MDPRAADWFRRRTSSSDDWPRDRVRELKQAGGRSVSVVIPARDEQATIAEVVGRIRRDLVDVVDEIVVMDSLSRDGTVEQAQSAGAVVHSVADVRPDLGVQAGKGEALWKSQFVTSGDILVFIDADLTEWGSHFVLGLVGVMLADPGVELVKGFYDRVDATSERPSTEGGRVTELVARPLLALHWPELGAVVQPLAGEWAIGREQFAGLAVPVGYGVELATLLDTLAGPGLDAIAQVDLGRRAHRHQSVHDLGVMAAEILKVADRRLPGRSPDIGDSVTLSQLDRSTGSWQERPVPIGERPPRVTTELPRWN